MEIFIGWRTKADQIRIKRVVGKKRGRRWWFTPFEVWGYGTWGLPVDYVREDEINDVLYPICSAVAAESAAVAQGLVEKDIAAKKKKSLQGIANIFIKLARKNEAAA